MVEKLCRNASRTNIDSMGNMAAFDTLRKYNECGKRLVIREMQVDR